MNIYDIKIIDVKISFETFENRVPLKFGHEVSTGGETIVVTMTIQGCDGKISKGYGETPLAAAWSWPSELSQSFRVERMRGFCRKLHMSWLEEQTVGHPMEIGWNFLENHLVPCLENENRDLEANQKLPYLAALVCCSAFDLALYDAYGNLHEIPVFDCFNEKYMNQDLSYYYTNEYKSKFAHLYPEQFLVPRKDVPKHLAACHLVGGKDLLSEAELTGKEPHDGYPVLLEDWIKRDGLFNLKIKLTGNDYDWDYARIVRVGKIGLANGVKNFTTDFNCTVEDPEYVCRMLDQLKNQEYEIWQKILYVEQPFPYDLQQTKMDVHGVSNRKLLLMDESAHDWKFIALGKELGWNGVALKTCKTLTGAMLSLCWARYHDMAIMVQDLTNLRLAIIPHVLLAANAGTIMGVEVNSMQFCPDASKAEEAVHPGLYTRRNGCIDLSTLGDHGFGYRLDEIRANMSEEEEKYEC